MHFYGYLSKTKNYLISKVSAIRYYIYIVAQLCIFVVSQIKNNHFIFKTSALKTETIFTPMVRLYSFRVRQAKHKKFHHQNECTYSIGHAYTSSKILHIYG